MIEAEARKAFSLVKPYAAVFVNTVDGNNKPTGLACGWHMKCSLNPPLYAVAIKKTRHIRDLIAMSGEFVVSFPSENMEKELVYFGTHSAKEYDKFKETGLKTRKSRYLRTPLLEEAYINLECFVDKFIEVGDHMVFVGKVVACYVKPSKRLLFYDGKDKEGKRNFKTL